MLKIFYKLSNCIYQNNYFIKTDWKINKTLIYWYLKKALQILSKIKSEQNDWKKFISYLEW